MPLLPVPEWREDSDAGRANSVKVRARVAATFRPRFPPPIRVPIPTRFAVLCAPDLYPASDPASRALRCRLGRRLAARKRGESGAVGVARGWRMGAPGGRSGAGFVGMKCGNGESQKPAVLTHRHSCTSGNASLHPVKGMSVQVGVVWSNPVHRDGGSRINRRQTSPHNSHVDSFGT